MTAVCHWAKPSAALPLLPWCQGSGDFRPTQKLYRSSSVQQARDLPEDDRLAVEESMAEMAEALESTRQGRGWAASFVDHGADLVNMRQAQWHVCCAEHCISEQSPSTHLDMAPQGGRQRRTQQTKPRRHSISARPWTPVGSCATEPSQQRQGLQRARRQRRGRLKQLSRPSKRQLCHSGRQRTPTL
jgi:hypothetical protein